MHSMLFRREAIRKGARFDASLPVCEDWDFWLQLQQQGQFRFVPETGAIYRMRVNSGSRVWTDQELSSKAMLQVYRKRLAGWSDKILWGIFEWARYKPRYDELADLHESATQKLHQRIASGEARLQQQSQEQAQERADSDARAASLRAALVTGLAHRDSIIAQHESRIAAHEHHVRSLQDQIAGIHASTSWRITQPLRSLVLRLRGRRAAAQASRAPQAAVARSVPQAQAQPPRSAQAPQQPAVSGEGVKNYDYEEDVNGQNAAAFVVQLTGKNKRVLEIGCGPGSITKLLKRYGACRVTGVELEEASIARAREFCEAIHQADLNTDSWPQVLGDASGFDIVVAADVLEHLYDPWKTLRQMVKLIGNQGSIVVSLPHAGHAVIAGCLFNGDVAYRNSGLLDQTHIRFFGLKNIEELFAQAKLKIVEARYVIKPPEETELHEQWHQLPEPVKAALKLSKHFDIYQVVVKAVPLDRPGAAVALI
jgi:2-polyprenyl-3-methyl-5-hydroxy-6-metoxy-1,4-benzoquinol methylase